MVPDGVLFALAPQLSQVGRKLADELLKSTTKPSKHINYQIELLELVAYEIKRYQQLQYCDFELTCLCYNMIQGLLEECKNHPKPEIQDFIPVITLTLTKKEGKIIELQKHLPSGTEHQSFGDQSSDDPLVSRFNKLGSSVGSTGPSTNSSPSPGPASIDKYKYTEIITAPELKTLLSQNAKVLLIDFRTKNEFNYNHINTTDIVNIEPSVVNSLLAFDSTNSDDVTDQDLEERLRLQLPDDQYKRFQQRHKYDLVVMYNLRYGISQKSVDRFESLTGLLINSDPNGNPSKSPFLKLVDLLAYRNKYISSRLKRAPCYLSGGVSFWHTVFGEGSITKTTLAPMISRPPASLSKDGWSSPSSSRRNSYKSTNSYNSSDSVATVNNGSPYLKNFGDYLGTAKTNREAPVSNEFMKSSNQLRASANGYTPSAALKPPLLESLTLESPTIGSDFSGDVSTKTLNVSDMSKTSVVSSQRSEKSDPMKFLDQYTTGLTNLGNSCYMNCVLQCLAATPQLTKFFFPALPLSDAPPSVQNSYRQHINSGNKLGTKGIITINFVSLLMNMFGNSGGSFTPRSFKDLVGTFSPGQQFKNNDQQDCIEFLTFLLDSLHEDLNQMAASNPKEKQAIMELTPEQEKTREYLPVRLASTIEWERYLKLNFSIIVDYFQGQYLSQLRCLECGLTSTTYNAFLILSLPIPEKLNNTSDVTLDDCLQEFVQTELLDDQNKWHCPRCKKFTRLTKKITITRLPQVLIVHFKRFKLSPTGYFSKMDTFVRYPVNNILDLTSYWPEVGTLVNPSINKSEVMPKEKEAQVLATLPARNQVPPFRYKLYGVANHYGNLTTGHYTSYVFKQSDKKKTKNWCYFDDAKVTYNHKESQVLNKNAYCLFYQRV